MTNYTEAEQIKSLVESAHRIVILQADNPDADSLGSALALEEILSDLGKEVHLYLGVDVPSYLHYLDGWDRVENQLPTQFDLSITVDTSADSLFDVLNKSDQRHWLVSRPRIVIDHHLGETTIPNTTVTLNAPAVATGEVIYELASQLGWSMNESARLNLLASIMSDSLGLTSEATTARSIQIVAELVESGIKIAALESKRRDLMRKSPDLIHYKGALLQRVEYFNDDRLAVVTIPWEEIEKYSYAYNPSMLVLDDMRQSTNTDVAIAFKVYNDGHITAKIRCNFGFGIGKTLAEHFGGGGHSYASGFRIEGKQFDEVKHETIEIATKLLEELPKKS